MADSTEVGTYWGPVFDISFDPRTGRVRTQRGDEVTYSEPMSEEDGVRTVFGGLLSEKVIKAMVKGPRA